ncbi:aminopeptidase N [Tessaracoccus sp. OS52]|uniref:aminopeptidase N n=1 Tax=Tessaracoccus sp. OS52 TaxID=2886691 RepID=UPI001D121930|nr:aminopeptidase N [Tessaracoccus sp. OS52]MCC2592089.1 aminopeptidase N [Tessaracoccus sp. OS52]
MSANLTREETAFRAAAIRLSAQQVTVDLRDCQDLQQPTYPVRSAIRLTTSQPETWVDYIGESVTAVLVDGQVRPVEFDGARVLLRDLPVGAECEVVVEGASLYSRTGEGLHRFQDPADGAVYLYTQYEPADARRVYPCFEQPDLKARYSFSIIGPEGWELVSNQPETARVDAGAGMVCVDFAETPPLSSYLTCICAGPYHRVGGEWSSPDGRIDVALGLLCRRSLAKYLDAEELLRITRAGLGYLHEAFGDYVWGKYDQVFVPEYNLGAMENPGLVTFTEHYLFRSKATPAQYQGRANTILHEMSHMWFGDLVTPRWWSDLWLKESFAEFMGAFLSGEAAGFDDAWLNFTGVRKAQAYIADSLPTTHPVVADIPDLEAAKNNFDRITYSKGAAALTQLVHYVGLENFFAGCRRYFSRHEYASATLADFLDALAETSGRDLESWARAWLLTSGHDTLAVAPTPASLAGASRPHATTVGLYDLVDGRLALRDRLDVVLEHPVTPLGELGAQPAAIIPNDTDQTFARIAFDDDTRAVLLQRVADLEPLTRAVVWAALWSDVRDVALPVADYVAAVVAHAPSEDRTGTLTALLAHVGEAIERYVPETRRIAAAASWRDACHQAARGAEPASSEQLQWTKAYLRVAAVAHEDVDWVTEGELEGLEVSDDLRWLAWQTRAAQGRASDEELNAALAADRTAAGVNAHLQAWYSRPDPALRAEAWRRAHVVGGETNDHVDALLAGVFAPGAPKLTAPFAQPYFDGLLDVWAEHPIGIAIRLVEDGYPRGVEHKPLSEAWLDAHPDAPAALRRLVVEKDAELAVAARVQRG